MKAKFSLLVVLLVVAGFLRWRNWQRASALSRAEYAAHTYASAICYGGLIQRSLREMEYDDAMSKARGVLGYNEPRLEYLQALVINSIYRC